MILQLRYRADIWVEVDIDAGDVVQVVVDSSTMNRPRSGLISSGDVAPRAARMEAERIAEGSEWPSWDYGPRPF